MSQPLPSSAISGSTDFTAFLNLLVAGRWSLVAGRWSLVAGRWSLVAGRWSLVAGRWSLVAGRWSLVWQHKIILFKKSTLF
ncbi:YXWGXW repeat-containing protein [Escherichia coli]|nr:YXWGXW repeat-containing protein [Escherichia coli]